MEVVWQKALGGELRVALVSGTVSYTWAVWKTAVKCFKCAFWFTGQQVPTSPILVSCRGFLAAKLRATSASAVQTSAEGWTGCTRGFLVHSQVQQMFTGMSMLAVPPKPCGCRALTDWRCLGKHSSSTQQVLLTCQCLHLVAVWKEAVISYGHFT